MLKKITIIAFVISSLFIVHDAFNSIALPNAGYSGAPGEQNCAASGCHVGVVQTGSSQLGFRVQNPPNTVKYTTNTSYTFLVNFPFGNVAEAGFIVAALDDNNNNAGTLENISNTDTLSNPLNGRKYIGHKNANSTIAWVFRWKAPTNYVGKVTFYCAALGANNDNLISGDITYLDSIQLLPFGSSNILDANFNVPNAACVNQVITATNTSTGTITSYNWNFGNGATPPSANTAGPHNITYSTPGTKTIKLIVSDGTALDSISKTITINAIPNAFAGNDQAICNGQSATLTATGGGTYLWSNQATTSTITVSPNTNTTYNLTVTQNGCTDTDDVTVTVNNTPVVNLSNASFCAGNSVTLNAGNAGATFLWSNQATSQSITVNTPNTYSVTVTRNNCSATSSAVVTQLNSLNIGLPPTASVCAGQSITLDAGNAGAIYLWSNNATSRTITVTSANTYSVIVTDPNGCTGRDTTIVSVNANPNVNINDVAICNGQSTIINAGNAGATYLWSNQATSQSISVTPSINTNYTVTVTNNNGCSASDNALVTVSGINTDDVVVCLGQPATLIATGATNYVWSTGETTASISVTPNDTTFYIVTGTVAGNCNNTDTAFVFPVTAITPVFQLPDTFCSNENQVLLDNYVNITGGVYSGIGVTGNIFNASEVNPGGPFTLDYEYSNLPGCTTQVSEQYYVIVAATINLNGLNAEYCLNDNIVVLQGSPFGGSFMGNGVVDNLFIPYFAEPGTHFISYNYLSANGCSSASIDTVVVHDVPQVIFFMNDVVFCENDAAVVLTGIPSGGTFTGQGVEQDTSFNPSLAGIGGPYALQYTFVDTNGCAAFATNIIQVNDNPDLTLIDVATSYCINDGVIDLNGLPQGGIFLGEAVTNNQLNTTLAGLGNDTLSYTYTNTFNCSSTISTIVAILDTPQVSIQGLDNSYCTNDVAQLITGVPSGGVFNGNGIQGDVFNPSLTIAGGPYNISYTYADNAGCTNTATALVFVNDAPELFIDLPDSIFCNNDDFNYTVTLFPENGVFTGAGVVGTSFNPSLAGEGTHILRYEFLSANGCFSLKDFIVVVNNCNSVEEDNIGIVSVYPNPANNLLNINTEEINTVLENILVTDIAGRSMLQTETSNQNSYTINIASLSKGFYFLHIKLSNNNSIIKKFTKQ